MPHRRCPVVNRFRETLRSKDLDTEAKILWVEYMWSDLCPYAKKHIRKLLKKYKIEIKK